MRIELTRIYVALEFEEINHWVYVNWIGSQTKEGIMAGADRCLQLLGEHQTPYLLNDGRHVVGSWDQAVPWLVMEWLPRAVAQGLTHFAHVMSKDTASFSSAELLGMGMPPQVHLRLFHDLPSAQAWLQAVWQQAHPFS